MAESVADWAERRIGMPPVICKALVAAQKAAKAVPKSDLADMEKYSYRYASSEDIIEEARAALASAGLAVLPVGWHLERGEWVGEGDQVAYIPDRIVVRYMLVHESGETWSADPVSTPSLPGRGRPDDKAEAAALTFNLGYYLRGLLLLPRSDAHEARVDQRDDSTHEQAPRPRRQNGGGPRLTIGFGPGKGTALEMASEEDLISWRIRCADKLDDPKWGQRNKQHVEAVTKILEQRASQATEGDSVAAAVEHHELIAQLEGVQDDTHLLRVIAAHRPTLRELSGAAKRAVGRHVVAAANRAGVSDQQVTDWVRGNHQPGEGDAWGLTPPNEDAAQ